MNPETAREKIADLVAGRLDEATAEKVRAYLLTDESAREFHDAVSLLYELDLEPKLEAPVSLRPYDTAAEVAGASGSAWARRLRWAAALLIVVGGAFAVYRLTTDTAPNNGTGPDSDSPSFVGVDYTPVPLLPVALSIPALPAAYHEGEWLDSREEAMLTSKYSGRPVLESYINPKCTVSDRVNKQMCQSQCMKTVRNFVWYRETFDGDVPAPVKDEVDARQIVAMLPAVRMSGGGDCDAETHWGISEWSDVEKKVQSYEERCSDRTGVMPECLDRESFEWNIRAIRAASELVDRGEYAEALTRLRTILKCEASCKTAFGQTARELVEQITGALDMQIARIDELSRGDDVQKAQAVDLACRFAPRVRGVDDLEERVLAFCAR